MRLRELTNENGLDNFAHTEFGFQIRFFWTVAKIHVSRFRIGFLNCRKKVAAGMENRYLLMRPGEVPRWVQETEPPSIWGDAVMVDREGQITMIVGYVQDCTTHERLPVRKFVDRLTQVF